MSLSKVFVTVRKLSNESNEEMLTNEVMNKLGEIRRGSGTIHRPEVTQVIRKKSREGKKVVI